MNKLNFTGAFSAHQGDIQLHSIDKLPSGLKKVEKNSFIAKSERSGHCHVLCGNYEMYETETPGNYVLDVKEECVMNHSLHAMLSEAMISTPKATPVADHNPTVVPPGIYHVGIQRRVNPFKKVWEQVKD